VLLEVAQNGVRLGELPRGFLAVKALAIDADFEGAACGRHQLQRTQTQLEREYLFRQTDGFGFVVSDRAIFDDDFRFH
jgi:hypothetical protein